MQKRTIAFLVYPNLTLLDLTGPLQVLKGIDGIDGIEVVTVGERVQPVPTDVGLGIVPERSLTVPRASAKSRCVACTKSASLAPRGASAYTALALPPRCRAPTCSTRSSGAVA